MAQLIKPRIAQFGDLRIVNNKRCGVLCTGKCCGVAAGCRIAYFLNTAAVVNCAGDGYRRRAGADIVPAGR